MSYAAPFSLLSFHLPDRDDSAEERLTWPLAGSLAIHVVILIAFVSVRFASSLEQPSRSYQVTLVTLPEIAASPTASPENKSTPERNADKVPPPKAKAGKAPKAAPQRQAVSPPSSVPQEKPRVPERVTDSLVGALESVVVPKPQALALPPKVAPIPPPPLPPLPVVEAPKPTPKQNAGKVPPPPKTEAGEAPKPERVTDSLVGALESVVVPKPQALALPPKVAPIPPPPLPPLPVVEAPKPTPKQNAGKVPPPPKTEAGEAPKPERVTDSLVGALESVVVPKPQALALPPKVAPIPPPPLPPLPVVEAPKPTPKQNAGKVPPPPKTEAGEAPKPERVTDSLVGALESVVVPKPQALALPPKVAPIPPPPLPPLPVVEAPKPTPKQNAGKVPPPPKTEAGEAPKPERVTDSLVGALESVVVPKPQALALPPKVAPIPPPPLPPLPVVEAPKPTPKQNAGKVPPPPKTEAGEAPKPERVTDSLVGALESVVVPKPQAPALPPKVAPIPPPPLPPLQVVEDPKPTPQPLQLASSPATGKPKIFTPAPALLAPTLKQAVGTIVVPKKPKQASSRVSPTVTSDGEQKRDTTKTPQSSGITLPPPAPPPAAVVPPKTPKKETPRQAARENSTAESLPPIPPVPEFKKPQPAETPSRTVPLVPETSSPPPKAAEARTRPPIVVPSAPQLAKVEAPVLSQPTVSKTTSAPRPIDKFDMHIPEVLDFDAQPVSKQTESGTQETLGLRVAGSCSESKENAYWREVKKKVKANIDKNRYLHRIESPAVLAFRVERNGQVTEPTVVRSSGNEKFDLAAKRAVLAATPLPPFPANMPQPFCQVQHEFTVTPNR